MLKAIIVDDEITAVDALREEISHYCPQVEIIAVCESFAHAVRAINELRPDLVFMDIHLGDGTGFNVIDQTEWKSYKTIFTTAYDTYAIKAFKTNAVDYLLKPISGIELHAAVSKVAPAPPNNSLPTMQQMGNKIAIQLSNGISLFDIHNIVHIKAEGNYSRIYCTNGEKLLSAKTLKDFEDVLAASGFIRIHHAHLINTTHLKKVHTKEGMLAEMSDGERLTVSQRKKGQLIAMIEQIKV